MATGRTSITGPALAMRRCKRTLLAVVGDAVRLVDLADDVPVRFVVDRDEFVLGREFFRQGRTLPLEGEERLPDLGDNRGVQVVGVAVGGGRQGLRFVDRAGGGGDRKRAVEGKGVCVRVSCGG